MLVMILAGSTPMMAMTLPEGGPVSWGRQILGASQGVGSPAGHSRQITACRHWLAFMAVWAQVILLEAWLWQVAQQVMY